MPTIDEKKATIVALLVALKKINSQIGDYEKSILNDNFQYAVKVSSGRLIIPQETVYDYEQSPAFVTEEQLQYAAASFIPSQIADHYQHSDAKNNKKEEKLFFDTALMHPEQSKPRGSSLKRVLILSSIIILGLVGYFVYGQITKEHQATQIEDDKSRVRNNITDFVTVGYDDYKYSKLGGIFGLVVRLRNNSNYMMENVKITITYIKADGGVWRNQDYDFEMLSSNSEGTIKIPDTNRGVSVRVRITGIKSVALGLN